MNPSGGGSLRSEEDIPEEMEGIVEGKARVLFEKGTLGSVFYNKAQVLNRDLSVATLRVFQRLLASHPGTKKMQNPGELTILEALSATGLRTIRYWNEVQGIRCIVANDLDAGAVKAIHRNLEHNQVPVVDSLKDILNGAHGAVITNKDAVDLMQKHRIATPEEGSPKEKQGKEKEAGQTPPTEGAKEKKPRQRLRFNVIDLDPYGTVVPFVDSSIQACEEGGMMMVTCTDGPVLCGGYHETAFSKYGSLTVKAKYCHEMAVRIILGTLETAAARYGRYIVPLFSLSIDFYFRVFIRVFTGKAVAKYAMTRMSRVHQCSTCSHFTCHPQGKARERGHGKKGGEGADKGKAGAPNSGDAGPEEQLRLAGVQVGPTKGLDPSGVKFGAAFAPESGTCPVCSSRLFEAGPIYSAPTQSPAFIRLVLAELEANKSEYKAFERARALLHVAQRELPDCPLFYHVPQIVSTVGTVAPPAPKYRAAVASLGYRVSPCHCDADALKTDAPSTVLHDVMRAWHDKFGQEQIERGKDTEGAEETAGTEAPKKGSKKERQAAARKQRAEKGGTPSGELLDRGELAKQLRNTWLSNQDCTGLKFEHDSKYDWSGKSMHLSVFPEKEANWGPLARAKPVKRKLAEEPPTAATDQVETDPKRQKTG